VSKTVRGVRGVPFGDDDFFRRFFPEGRGGAPGPDAPDRGEQNAPEFRQMGNGSGVVMEVVDGKAYILTNNHVAGDAEEMIITLSDGRKVEKAKLIGTDPLTDLAVVEIETDRVIAAKWGSSDELQKE